MPVIYYWSVGVSLTYFRDITIVYDAECPSPVHSDSDIVENEKQRNMAFIHYCVLGHLPYFPCYWLWKVFQWLPSLLGHSP